MEMVQTNTADEIDVRPLPDGISLEVLSPGEGPEPLFRSQGKWLYPLFELEEFLDVRGLKAEDLYLHDRIAGRAAASLICRMGFRRCHIDTISEPAKDVFEKNKVFCSYDHLVDKILCKTEDIISADMKLNEVYGMLKRRAGLIHGISVEIMDLTAAYAGKKPVLKGLSLSLHAGERLVITGENGAGKSTLMKTLIGALQPSGGHISFGEPGKNLKGVSSGIAYVNQSGDQGTQPISVTEIVEIGFIGRKIDASARKHETEIALRRCGCFHLRNRDFHSLSGGERQRVSLARCLCQKAGLILLDEPTSFLDAEAKDDFLKLLKQISHNQIPTLILVSHDHGWIEKLGWPTRELRDGCLC